MAEKKKYKNYIVYARSNDTLREHFLKINAGGMKARVIPFDKPIPLTDEEVAAIKRMKEPVQMKKRVDVHEIMEKHKVPQDKANKMAQLIEDNPDIGGKEISWVPKYIVTPA